MVAKLPLSSVRGSPRSNSSALSELRCDRQLESKHGAAAHGAVDRDGAAVQEDDVAHDREAEPRAAAIGLGGEEGIENALHAFGIDTVAGVGHAHLDCAAQH